MSLIGQTISNYQVLAQLGGGGMGVVYRARDTKLKRDVVLKFLPTGLSQDEEANERFMQEAQAASALNHENVCVVYDIKETDDGRLYIVMPLYDGDTLKNRLEERNSGLDPNSIRAVADEETLNIVGQIASGLAAAHDKGITHRDIKPANIMVTDSGRVIILDFGLAKLTGGLDLTKTGSTVGTAYYMSPEQVRGERVDARADLWSLGVVFFQLLTGKRPFEGDYEQAVMYSILNHEPLPDAGLPDDIAVILGRLLSKNPDGRFESASDVVEALKSSSSVDQPVPDPMERKNFLPGKRTVVAIVALLVLAMALAVLQPWKNSVAESASEPDMASEGAGVSEPERNAIAVLPFTNLREDPETDFLGYAMADQVIGKLSYVKNLNVRPASSVRPYQDQQYNAREAGRDLAVTYVVTGNYLSQDDRMRLTVEMVDVEKDEIIWTEPIEVQSDDVFEMQDIVARILLERLEVSFSEDERSNMQADVSSNPLAYEYYLRALSHPRTVSGNELAVNLLGQSLALDSTYAPAWSELGFRRYSLGLFGMGGGDVSRSAETAFERALQLNPDLISAMADVSTYYADGGRTDEAYELAVRAIEVNPKNAMGHFARGYALRYSGMMEESEREMRMALDLDSTNVRFRSAGLTLMINEQFDDARRAFAIDKPSAYYVWSTVASLLRQDETQEAAKVLESSPDLEQSGLNDTNIQSFRALLSGDHDEVVAIARAIEEASLVDAESKYYNALYFCLAGDPDGCLRNLDVAVETGYFNYPNLSKDPWLDSIRGRPDFDEILEKARLKHERFRAKYFSDR